MMIGLWMGPRSMNWVSNFVIAQTGGTLSSRVQQFMSVGKLNYRDGSMAEFNLIARCMDMAISWDGLSIGNLACMELLARRFQLIEERYKHRMPSSEPAGGQLDPEADSSLYLGLGLHSAFGRHSICVMPQLSMFVGEELAREAVITKGKVKAHELREQMKKLAKGRGKDMDSE